MPTVHSFSNASAHAAKPAAVEIADGFGDFGWLFITSEPPLLL